MCAPILVLKRAQGRESVNSETRSKKESGEYPRIEKRRKKRKKRYIPHIAREEERAPQSRVEKQKI